MWATKYNKTPSSHVNHRRSTEFLTITKTCSYSSFNLQDLQDKILLCIAWFNTIPGTWEMFSQVALYITNSCTKKTSSSDSAPLINISLV